MADTRQGEKNVSVVHVTSDNAMPKDDVLAVEEPMEIRIVSGPVEKRKGKSLSITMRTPGNDFELAAGFLFTEGIISERSHIEDFEAIGKVSAGRTEGNIVRVCLSPELDFDAKKLQRHFYTTSSCGVCGKGSLDALDAQGLVPIGDADLKIEASLVRSLPSRLRTGQDVFDRTGGLHAAALFDSAGELISIREDVGRHNALDKLIGEQFLAKQLPLDDKIVVLSGRASFELLQKSLTASVPMLIVVGAPSSLAVELAVEYQMTLIGFASESRFNIYSVPERVSI